ncbi:VOC family protein [candidate division WOR-3 bacterium]|nr:VOC family protein [candidate division WOR-3 bacterium]
MIAHVAVTVSSADKANEFFKEVLNCKFMYSYGLDATASNALFGINLPTQVYIYMSEEDWIEVFVQTAYKRANGNFDHVCFRTEDIPGVVARGQKLGYSFIRHRTTNKTVLFVKDKDGNLYELKKTASDEKSPLS